MAFYYLLSILFVSSLAPILIQSEELLSDETLVRSRWIAPRPEYAMESQRERRNAEANINAGEGPATNTLTGTAEGLDNSTVTLRKAPHDGHTMTKVAHNSQGPPGPPHSRGDFRKANHGPNRGHQVNNQHNVHGANHNGSRSYPPGNSHVGMYLGGIYDRRPYLPLPPPPHHPAPYGEIPGPVLRSIENLIVVSVLSSDKCEIAPAAVNLTTLLLVDKVKLCADKAIIDTDKNTITAKFAKDIVVNKLTILASSIQINPAQIVIEILALVSSGPNSLEGQFAFIKLIIPNSFLDQKCHGISSNVQADLTLLVVEHLDLATCLPIFHLCLENIRSQASFICHGSAIIN